MRIAVDARPLGPPLTGIGVDTASLLERLLDSGHQWFLYSDRMPVEGDWIGHPQVTLRYGRAAPSSLSSLFIANACFQRWARQDDVDLFWSPRHHLPLLLPLSIPSVVTVHDLVWLRYPETIPLRSRWVERLVMARSIARASRIIAVSGFTLEEVVHFYPAARDRCRIIHEAGRLVGDATPSNAEEPYFLFVEPLSHARTWRCYCGATSGTSSKATCPSGSCGSARMAGAMWI